MPTIELFGQARLLAGVKTVAVEGRTVGDALRALAMRRPQLVGTVLEEDGRPTAAYVVNLNGVRFCTNLNLAVSDEDELLLMSSLSGG
jgi:sulfur-carrier protein